LVKREKAAPKTVWWSRYEKGGERNRGRAGFECLLQGLSLALEQGKKGGAMQGRRRGKEIGRNRKAQAGGHALWRGTEGGTLWTFLHGSGKHHLEWGEVWDDIEAKEVYTRIQKIKKRKPKKPPKSQLMSLRKRLN